MMPFTATDLIRRAGVEVRSALPNAPVVVEEIRQAKPFAELWMYRREEEGGAPAEAPADRELADKGAQA